MLGLVNAFVRPMLVLLTLPVTILTLGLFIFVLNGLLFWMVGSWLEGFEVAGFWSGVFGAILFSLRVRWCCVFRALRRSGAERSLSRACSPRLEIHELRDPIIILPYLGLRHAAQSSPLVRPRARGRGLPPAAPTPTAAGATWSTFFKRLEIRRGRRGARAAGAESRSPAPSKRVTDREGYFRIELEGRVPAGWNEVDARAAAAGEPRKRIGARAGALAEGASSA